MNLNLVIRGFLVVLEDEKQVESKSAIINYEQNYEKLLNSLRQKFQINVKNVYYYDCEGEKCFLCSSNYDLMIEEKQQLGLNPYSILHAIGSI